MPTISEEHVKTLLEKGNGSSVLIPSDGGGWLKLSYLWGKLRVDTCDEDGKILLPARRVEGSDSPFTPTS